MALINHSCTPNTSTMVLKSRISASSSVSEEVIAELSETGAVLGSNLHRMRREPCLDTASSFMSGKPSAGPSEDSKSRNTATLASDNQVGNELMMLVRAAKEIKAGEEISIAYTGRYTLAGILNVLLKIIHEAVFLT
jgi:SET domain-containing protein